MPWAIREVMSRCPASKVFQFFELSALQSLVGFHLFL
jgi:hypothetical protein